MSWSVGAGLSGKGVIVTGAAGGIGRAVTEAFATTGARVMAVDVDQARVDEVVAGLEGSGHVGVAADLRDLGSHAPLVARAREELGNLYVLANLAAVLRRKGSLDEVTEDDWDFQHDVNLKAAFFLARAAGDAMIEQGEGGRIILFSSQGWWTGGFGGSVAYAATKGGVTWPGRSVRTR
jgi:NAD(P)-dependent dehydrogenase (short-subunit alcohol dehydrogenase family)